MKDLEPLNVCTIQPINPKTQHTCCMVFQVWFNFIVEWHVNLTELFNSKTIIEEFV